MSNTQADIEHQIRETLRGYIDAMVWANTLDPDTCEPADLEPGSVEPTAVLFGQALADVRDFVTENAELLYGLDPEQVGHDLALTRNGHGTGFWDRGLGARGTELTKLAHALGEETWVTTDDGRVELFG